MGQRRLEIAAGEPFVAGQLFGAVRGFDPLDVGGRNLALVIARDAQAQLAPGKIEHFARESGRGLARAFGFQNDDVIGHRRRSGCQPGGER